MFRSMDFGHQRLRGIDKICPILLFCPAWEGVEETRCFLLGTRQFLCERDYQLPRSQEVAALHTKTRSSEAGFLVAGN